MGAASEEVVRGGSSRQDIFSAVTTSVMLSGGRTAFDEIPWFDCWESEISITKALPLRKSSQNTTIYWYLMCKENIWEGLNLMKFKLI